MLLLQLKDAELDRTVQQLLVGVPCGKCRGQAATLCWRPAEVQQ